MFYEIWYKWHKIHQRNFMMVLEPCLLERERERELKNAGRHTYYIYIYTHIFVWYHIYNKYCTVKFPRMESWKVVFQLQLISNDQDRGSLYHSMVLRSFGDTRRDVDYVHQLGVPAHSPRVGWSPHSQHALNPGLGIIEICRGVRNYLWYIWMFPKIVPPNHPF